MWEKKIINILKRHWSTKPRTLCWQKILKKGLLISEDGASECASGDIEQVIITIFLNMIELHCIDDFLQKKIKNYDDFKYDVKWIQEIWKNKSKFKIVKDNIQNQI